jgi:hypothetical protein
LSGAQQLLLLPIIQQMLNFRQPLPRSEQVYQRLTTGFFIALFVAIEAAGVANDRMMSGKAEFRVVLTM